MNFSVLPPEVNSALVLAGAGPEPLLAAAASWAELAEELGSAAASFGGVTSGLVGGSWQGPSAAAMATAAAPYADWLASAAGQAGQAAMQAQALVTEFDAVRSAIVQPIVLSANRSNLVSLVMSNLFGQNAPAIASFEAAYEQMWAQDVAAMAAYHGGASAVVSALAPFAEPLQGVVGLSGQLAGLPGAVAAGTPLNVGLGNLGVGNFGWGNLGSNNFGFGNLGSGNVGPGNLGSGNTGFANTGNNNVGFGNTGNNNIGIGLTGTGQVGIGLLNTGTGNLGLFNSGTGNVGLIQLRHRQCGHR